MSLRAGAVPATGIAGRLRRVRQYRPTLAGVADNPIPYLFIGFAAHYAGPRKDIVVLAIGAIAMAMFVRAIWRRPLVGLIALAALAPWQSLVQSELWKHGLNARSAVWLGYWKEAVFVVLIARAFSDRRAAAEAGEQRPLAGVDLVALMFLAVVALYLVLPLGAPLNVRYIAARADASMAVLFLVARHLRLPDNAGRRVTTVVLVCGAAFASMGIWNYFRPTSWTTWVNGTGIPTFRAFVLKSPGFPPVVRGTFGHIRAGSIFLDPLGFAYLMLVVVGIAAARLLGHKPNFLTTAVAVLSALAVVVTFTRSALALLPVVVLLAVFGSRQLGRGAAVLVAGAIAFATIAASTGATDRLSTSLNTSDPSTAAHASALRTSTARVLTHPFGSGLGTVSEVANRFAVQNRVQTTENFYLQIALEIGVVGSLFFTVFVLTLWRQLWIHRWRSEIAVGAAAGLAGLILGAIVLHTFVQLPATWAAFTVAGLALNTRRQPDPDDRRLVGATRQSVLL